jgi:hypothetical protein
VLTTAHITTIELWISAQVEIGLDLLIVRPVPAPGVFTTPRDEFYPDSRCDAIFEATVTGP